MLNFNLQNQSPVTIGLLNLLIAFAVFSVTFIFSFAIWLVPSLIMLGLSDSFMVNDFIADLDRNALNFTLLAVATCAPLGMCFLGKVPFFYKIRQCTEIN